MAINKNWLKEFFSKCKFEKINNILLNEESSLKYKDIIDGYLKNQNLYNIEMFPIPSINEKIINNIYKYFDNFELITNISYETFSNYFGIKNQQKSFCAYLIDYNYIFIQYDEISGEIINMLGTERYLIYSKENLEKIKDNLMKYGFINVLSMYQIDLKTNNKEWKLFNKNKKVPIGILLNINIFKKENNNGKNEKEEVIYNEEEKEKIIFKEEVLENDNKKNNNRYIEEKEYILKDPKKISINLSEVRKNNNKKDKKVIGNNYNYYNFKNNNFLILNKKNDDINNIINNVQNIKETKDPFINNVNNNDHDINDKNNINNYNNDNINDNDYEKLNNMQNNKTMENFSLKKTGFNNKIIYNKKKISDNFGLQKNKLENNIQQKYKTPSTISKTRNIFNKTYFSNFFNKNLKKYQFETIKEKEPYLNNNGLKGLLNIDSPCYINATLHCLSNIPRLRDKLLKAYKVLSQEKNLKRLSFALSDIFTNLWENSSNNNFSPKYFKNVIIEMNPLFNDISSNNLMDFILFLLENIHNELNQKNQRAYFSNSNNLDFFSYFNDFKNYYKNNNESIISEEFYGYYDSMKKCYLCKATSHNVKILNILFFPLEEVRKFIKTSFNVVNLSNCFDYYESSKLIDNGKKIYCDYCKNNSQALLQNKIIIAPKTLIIYLDRGKESEYNVGIEFEQNLNLKKYIFNNNDSPYNYELIGVISRLNSNNIGKHFISYGKNSNNLEWYKFNDFKITKSSFEEINKVGLPYVLFYSFYKV